MSPETNCRFAWKAALLVQSGYTARCPVTSRTQSRRTEPNSRHSIGGAQSQAELVALFKLSAAETVLATSAAIGTSCWAVGAGGSAWTEVERLETDDCSALV